MTYFCAIILMAVITYQWIQLTAQQRTIKDLNDRLMARSYAEYAAGKAREDPPPELQTRSPKSWYDDPNILDGDDE
ncbi:hypothetical protein P9847_18660 [Paenibacillus chibensis]|uniref:Uncharacterized protein n=1 Tax=Paenibacillus chibensis TaxID=59846 RepID=A0ABU6PWZ5_9BACL|nr:hypothetical protein [Paenibacillus chibensis]